MVCPPICLSPMSTKIPPALHKWGQGVCMGYSFQVTFTLIKEEMMTVMTPRTGRKEAPSLMISTIPQAPKAMGRILIKLKRMNRMEAEIT